MRLETLKPSKKRSRPVHVRRYDSVNEEVVETLVRSTRLERIVDRDDYEGFIGRRFNTVVAIKDAATKGCDQESIDVINDFRKRFADNLPEPKTIRRSKKWDEMDGDTFDNDRFRSGQQAWCRATREVTRAPKTITIAMNIGGNCGTYSKDLMWSPAAAIAMSDLLEEAGYSVKLIGCTYATTTYHNGDDTLAVVSLKEPGVPVDVSTLSTFASGWFFRTIGISERDLGQSQSASSTCSTYGCSRNDATLLCTNDEVDADAVGNMYSMPQVFNFNDALAYAKLILENIDNDQN